MEIATSYIILRILLDFTIKYPGKEFILFFYKNHSESKKLRIFQDGLHDIHKDNDSDLFKKIISEWLTERLNSSPKKLGNEIKSKN